MTMATIDLFDKSVVEQIYEIIFDLVAGAHKISAQGGT